MCEFAQELTFSISDIYGNLSVKKKNEKRRLDKKHCLE